MGANQSSLLFAVKSSWALLLGFGILMLGDGLQASLLAIRADQEGFTATMTGLMMSAFYIGFLCGSKLTPRIMTHVGHVRVFAALAAIASAAILVHALYVDIYSWSGLRLISGFCFAGLYVVAESWLNDRATNQSRGKVLSLYMVVTYIGVGAGQLFLNLANPLGHELFILVSVLISLAVLPLLLSAGSPPRFDVAASITLRQLYNVSPLGIVGIFNVGLVTAAFFALGPIYGQRLGFTIREISYFMTAAVIGTVLFQWPIGSLSDRFDRRRTLTIITFLAALAAVVCAILAQESLVIALVLVGMFCGLTLPLYSVCIAYTNDHLHADQMIAASGTLVLVGGIGAVIGPILIAGLMDQFGNAFFFYGMSGALFVTVMFAVYRMTRRSALDLQQQGAITPTAVHASSSAMEGMQQVAQSEAISSEE